METIISDDPQVSFTIESDVVANMTQALGMYCIALDHRYQDSQQCATSFPFTLPAVVIHFFSSHHPRRFSLFGCCEYICE
jgi:hypothetical protein